VIVVEVVDLGYGLIIKGRTFETVEEEKQHYALLEIRHRSLCESFGLDYDEVIKEKKERTA
jgi:HSP20 family molecular chaperone IbpA